MYKLTLVIVLALSSTISQAADFASASINNFSYTVISGDNVTLLFDTPQFNLNTNVFDLDGANKNEYLFTMEVPANASLNTVLGDASAVATVNDDAWTTTAISNGGNSSASLNVASFIDYKANTLIMFSATATVSGSGKYTQGVQANSSANLNLFNTSFDGGFSQISAGANLGSGSAFGDQYALTKQLKFYFYDDADARIQVNASLYASISEPFISTVPELETNAMFLAGLGVFGYFSKRRNRTN